MKSSTSFKPGQSGNVKGRPPNNHSLAEAIREGARPAELVEAALRILREGEPAQQIQALNWIAANGYSKPPERHEVQAEQVLDSRMVALIEAARMTPHERRKALEEEDADDHES
ncbi:MAG: hypothetical protein H0X39_00980 [Actinobacteria bacterium]|nr:hypothetical protein [Actinomycetota bacterium]